MKYFKEEMSKFKLSELMQKSNEDLGESYICEQRDLKTMHLISVIGDIELDAENYIAFLKEFSYLGGRYDVRTDNATFNGVYEMLQKYPRLSSLAIKGLFSIYIKDLFEQYMLPDAFQCFINKYGETDEAFEKYYEYMENKADDLALIYVEESKKADILSETYSDKFCSYVKSMIERKHYLYADIDKWIPSSKIIKADEKTIADFSRTTRIYFCCCYPVSYSILKDLVKGEELQYGEKLQYIASSGLVVDAPFTVQEYLDSVKERQKEKTKLLTRK